jgi:integrase
MLRIKKYAITIGLPYRILQTNWNQEKQRVRSKGDTINLFLQELKSDILNLEAECIRSGETFDKNLLLKRITLLNPAKDVSFLGMFKEFVSYKTKTNASVSSYESTFLYLHEFNSKRKILTFNDMTQQTAESLHFFLCEKNLTDSTIAGKFRDLKAFLRWCEEMQEIRVHQGYKNYKSVKWENVNHLALSIEELRLIEQADFSNDARLHNAKNLFLLQCYTGLRRSDLKQLLKKKTEIRRDAERAGIHLTQQKTSDKVYVPLIPPALEIIDSETLHDISDQRYNEYIKEVCKESGLIQPYTLTRHRGTKREDTQEPMHEHITSHTARRTFATLAIHYYKLSEYDAMKLTGHRTVESFRQYVKKSQSTQLQNNYAELWKQKNK